MKKKLNDIEERWKEKLSSEQYQVLRKKGTELPFTGEYLNNKKKGVYTCIGCGKKLFSSEAKFDSGTGWPSFDKAMKDGVKEQEDNKFLMKRTEVVCPKCGGHLGHVFNDGPTKTKKRYCINSLALGFKEKK